MNESQVFTDALKLADPDDLLDLDAALDRLAAAHPRRAELGKLRYFSRLTLPEVAGVLGILQVTPGADWT